MATYSLKVVLSFSAPECAENLNKILLPDLVQVPNEMQFKQQVQQEKLVFYVADKSFGRARSTIDEVLGHCQLAIKLGQK